MSKFFHERMSYANVVATLALVFAMSGGALAASKFLITSTKQIKPSVLAQLKGKTGAQGPAGPAGALGSVGEKGASGLMGEKGSAGAPGTNGKDGESVVSGSLNPGEEGCVEGGSKFTVGGKTTTACNGEKGEPGQPGPPGTTGFTRTLPKGETETGTWDVHEMPFSSTEFKWLVSISFPISLKSPIEVENVHVIADCEGLSGEPLSSCEAQVKSSEPFCPGSVSSPKAKEGSLCIYEGFGSMPPTASIAASYPLRPAAGFEPGAGTSGTAILVSYSGPAPAEQVYRIGSWAVTAS